MKVSVKQPNLAAIVNCKRSCDAMTLSVYLLCRSSEWPCQAPSRREVPRSLIVAVVRMPAPVAVVRMPAPVAVVRIVSKFLRVCADSFFHAAAVSLSLLCSHMGAWKKY